MATRRLVISSEGQGQFFLLVEGDIVTIGDTRPDAASVLEHLRVVRIHCELEVEGDRVTLRSDEAGRPGDPQEMRPGEVLHAGGSRLCLEAAADAPAQEVGRGAGLQPAAPPGQVTNLPHAPAAEPGQPAPQPRRVKRLLVIDGADQGQVFPLPESGTVTLGKDRKHADIVLHDFYVARVHCSLKIEGDKVEVVDEGVHGTLGTLINGQKVTRQTMGLGDVLRIGNSRLRLEVAGAGEEFAKVAGPGAGAEDEGAIKVAEDEGGTDDEEPVELVVDEEEPGEEGVGGGAGGEDGAESLPENASEPVRLLHLWRDKLGQLSGQTFGHYRLGPVLGRGRCGVVFRADDLKTGQALALKVFSPQFPHGDQELQRFARVLKGMLPLRHPNLVALYAAGKTGAYTWVAREYVEGESLAEVIRRLARTRRFDERRACRVAVHVGRALDFARQHHFRHGKVTPANVLIGRGDKAAKLADLMLGAVLEGSQLWQAVVEHRPAAELSYLSPEQADPGAFVDELSDLYGLGAVVYALLTGRPPFVGDTADEVLEQVRGATRVARPSAFNAAIPAALEKVVLKMLAKRQEDRYQTPAELLADLEPIAAEQGVEG